MLQIQEIEVTISHKITTRKYESVTPTLSVKATIEKGDDTAACAAKLHKFASKIWAKQALLELAWVAKRGELHEFTETTKASKAQIKSMM